MGVNWRAMNAYHLRATLLPYGESPVDLWIDDGRFRFSPVDGAEELATGRLFALPGMVDCHAHLALDFTGQDRPWTDDLIEENLRAHLASGTLSVRDPGSPDGSTIRWQGREGLPRVQAAGRFLAPEGRYLPFAEWTEPAALAQAATAQARAGARWVKVVADWPDFGGAAERLVHPQNYSPEVLGEAVAAAHAAGARVAVHAAGPLGAANAVAAGVDSVEHGDGLTEELLAQMVERGIAWTPTIAMTENVARMMVEGEAAQRAFANDRFEAARYLLPIAARLGVTILAGTDALPHGSVALEVEALIRFGLDPPAALASASTGARAFLGEDVIEEWAAADLVLFGADPRSTPEVLRTPQLVLLGGSPVLGR